MLSKLAKRWFLLGLVIGVALVGWRPDWFGPTLELLSPLAIVSLALFFMAITLSSRSLWGALVHPLSALWATIISYGLVPCLGWAAGTWLLDTEPGIGLMIITSVPCTLASAVLWTRLADGNEAVALLTILLTISTSWLATATWLAFGTGQTASVEAWRLMSELFLVLILPVGAGQVLRLLSGVARAADRHRRLLGVLSQLLILAMILKAAYGLVTKLDATTLSLGPPLFLIGLVTVAIHLAGLACGFWTSKLWGFDPPTCSAIAFGCSQKTLPVALYIYESHFQSFPLAVVPILFYHLGQLVVDTFIAEKLASLARRQASIDAPNLQEQP
jgi:sodium/bile acid cotransporter 7